MFRLAIGLAGFHFLEVATKYHVKARDLVHLLLLVCMSIMCIYSCLLVLARFGLCIIWACTQIWETRGVRGLRIDVIALSDFMKLGGVAWFVCLVALVLFMQFPCACPV